MQACCICECWENVPRAWPPAPRTKVFRSRCCTAPQLHGRAGLGRTAPGTSYKGISFRVLRCPAGVGCTAPRTSYTAAFPFKVCAAPQIHRPAGLGCTATGTSYKGISFRVVRGPAAARPRGFRVHGPRGISFRVLRGPAGSRPRVFRVHGLRDFVQRYFF